MRLKAARARAGFSQGEAAARAQLAAHSTLAEYEQGRSRIPVDVLACLARLYRVSVSDVLGLEPDQAGPSQASLASEHNRAEEEIATMLSDATASERATWTDCWNYMGLIFRRRRDDPAAWAEVAAYLRRVAMTLPPQQKAPRARQVRQRG